MTEQQRTMHRLRIGAGLVTTAFECFVLAEILWYYLHDGEHTLHQAIAEWWHSFQQRNRARAVQEQAREETLKAIRDLPETQREQRE